MIIDFQDVGDDLLKKTYIDVDSMIAEAVSTALGEAEQRHANEMKELTLHLKHQAEQDKEKALARTKKVISCER